MLSETRRVSPTLQTLCLFVFFALISLFIFDIWFSNHHLALEDLSVAISSTSPGSRIGAIQADPVPTTRPPKITVIAIWMGRQGDRVYLPYFFQSVEANPKINLLFVNVLRDESKCKKRSSAPNIQELCLSEKNYYLLHVDYLCKLWYCSEAERKVLFDRITQQGRMDYNYSFFRILRSGIFEKWIDPATTIWGWCDFDTFWGNFDRIFPWDIAPNYDIIAITSQPDFSDQRLLFTRGHLAFFRHSPETLQKLNAYPPFTSLEMYLKSPQPREDAEESQFSHYYFATDDSFTFLHVEGMVETGPSTALLISEMGTFYLDILREELNATLRENILSIIGSAHHESLISGSNSEELGDDQTHKALSTFTWTGVQKPSPVKTEGYQYWLWFPEEYVAYYEPGWGAGEREHKAYFMRSVEHGPTEQRLERRDRYVLDADGLRIGEGLYIHFQVEKHKAWFKRFPKARLPLGHTMVLYHREEGEIWDEAGNVVFESGRD